MSTFRANGSVAPRTGCADSNHSRKWIREPTSITFLCCLTYCFVGWLYEVIVYAFELHQGFVNRGFLFGPWLPVYGIGELIIVAGMFESKNKPFKIRNVNIRPILCYISIVIVSTITELIASYFLEALTGSWLWDYSHDIPNFQGRIALKSSLRFGILGMVGLYAVHPTLSRKLDDFCKEHPAAYRSIVALLAVLFGIDLVGSLCNV